MKCKERNVTSLFEKLDEMNTRYFRAAKGSKWYEKASKAFLFRGLAILLFRVSVVLCVYLRSYQSIIDPSSFVYGKSIIFSVFQLGVQTRSKYENLSI